MEFGIHREESALILYDPFFYHLIDDVFERASEPEYQIYGSQLQEALHYERADLFEEGIARAMHAFEELNLPLEEHFEAVFLCDEQGVHRDYLLSRLACYFITIHIEPINQRVAEAQLFFLMRR